MSLRKDVKNLQKEIRELEDRIKGLVNDFQERSGLNIEISITDGEWSITSDTPNKEVTIRVKL